MSGDELFRWVVIAGFVFVFPIGVYHRLATRTSERLDRWQEGWWILFPLRILGLAGIAGVVALRDSSAVDGLGEPAAARLAPLGGCCVGSALRRPSVVDPPPSRQESDRHGGDSPAAYARYHGTLPWVRHPFYVAFALAALANALVTANWFVLATGISAWILISLRTPKEEAKLIERFGDEYIRYCDRTGRFFPRLSHRTAP